MMGIDRNRRQKSAANSAHNTTSTTQQHNKTTPTHSRGGWIIGTHSPSERSAGRWGRLGRRRPASSASPPGPWRTAACHRAAGASVPPPPTPRAAGRRRFRTGWGPAPARRSRSRQPGPSSCRAGPGRAVVSPPWERTGPPGWSAYPSFWSQRCVSVYRFIGVWQQESSQRPQ